MAHYCLHKLNMLPSQYESLPRREKAFIIASIQVKSDDEKKESDKINNTVKKGKRKKGR